MAKTWAINFLCEALAQGPVATTELEARAKAEGLSWASLRRAKQQLKIEAIRESRGIGGDGRWLWSLPKALQNGQDAQVVQPPAAVQVAQAAQLQTAQSTQPPVAPPPRRQRVILVKQVPQGPDEISFEQWRALGSETGRDCPRIREFLRQRGTLNP
jgi:hypothetical protein